ncbi:hypothetical protein [Metallibacterium scheffleri]
MKQRLGSSVVICAGPVWRRSVAGIELMGRGSLSMLDAPLTAFFASRQCPGAAIRAAMDWALGQARSRQPVIGGFHAPLEQSVLSILIHAHCPVVAVLARPTDTTRLPTLWQAPLRDGYMVVMSGATRAQRLTCSIARARNQVVALCAHQIVVAHASAQGTLAAQCVEWREQGRAVRMLLDA